MDMLNDYCGVATDGRGVARLVLCNAGSLNIVGTPAIDALRAGLAELAKRPGLRVLVFAAASEKAFIGGADIKEMATLDQASAERFIANLRDLCEAVRHFPVPVVARLPGWCLGGGLEVAMACDLRIAAADARFAMPEVKVGIPSVIHAALMPRLIGWARARWLILTAATIDAGTARDWGLVDAVAGPAGLDAEVEKAVTAILACAPGAIATQKKLLRDWEDLSLTDSVAVSVPAFGESFLTGEPQRLMRAFLDRKNAAAPD